jgi:proline iminopeptidase
MSPKVIILSFIILFAIINSKAQRVYFDTTQSILNSFVETCSQIRKIPENITRLDLREGVKTGYKEINGAQLYIQEEGKGVPVLLIHGGPGGTSHVFHPFFGNYSDSCHLIYYDQRGCGLSEFTGKRTYTLKKAMEDIEALRQILDIEKWYMLGYSYGGVLAQLYTLKHPEHVLGTILVGAEIPCLQHYLTAGNEYKYISKYEKEQIFTHWDNIDREIVDEPTGLYNADLNGAWKRQHFYKPTIEYLAQTALYEWRSDNSFRNRIHKDLYDLDLSNCFKECPIPFLIIEGVYDRTWGKEKSTIISNEFPYACIHYIDRAAHTPFQSNPKKFFQLFKDFIKHNPPLNIDVLKQWKEDVAQILSKNRQTLKHENRLLNNLYRNQPKNAFKYYEKHKSDGIKLFTPIAIPNIASKYFKKKQYSTAIQIIEMGIEQYPGIKAFNTLLDKINKQLESKINP